MAAPAPRDREDENLVTDGQPPVDELFGDEDLGLDAAPRTPEPVRRKGPIRIAIAGVAVVVFALLWYASSVHHDQFYLKLKGDTVRVARGWYFPFGSSEWTPNRAYESFKLPPGVEPEKTGAMSAKQLDQVLLNLFVAIAERELEDLEGGNPDVAEDMLLRANKLQFTSVSDDRRLLEMLGDVAFRRGLTEVRNLQMRFDEALTQFRLAAMRGGNAYRGAQRWVDAITRLREEFRRLSVESGIDPDRVLAPPPSMGTLPPPPPTPAEPDKAPPKPEDNGKGQQ